MTSVDAETGALQVVLDDGVALPVAPDALPNSGLLHLRPGQRVSIEIDGIELPPSEGFVVPLTVDSQVTRLWITGIGPGQIIA